MANPKKVTLNIEDAGSTKQSLPKLPRKPRATSKPADKEVEVLEDSVEDEDIEEEEVVEPKVDYSNYDPDTSAYFNKMDAMAQNILTTLRKNDMYIDSTKYDILALSSNGQFMLISGRNDKGRHYIDMKMAYPYFDNDVVKVLPLRSSTINSPEIIIEENNNGLRNNRNDFKPYPYYGTPYGIPSQFKQDANQNVYQYPQSPYFGSMDRITTVEGLRGYLSIYQWELCLLDALNKSRMHSPEGIIGFWYIEPNPYLSVEESVRFKYFIPLNAIHNTVKNKPLPLVFNESVK